jgi:ankyrin repeat protein
MFHFLLKTKDTIDIDPLIDDNNISLFENLDGDLDDQLTNKMFSIACGKGQLEFIKWMDDKFGLENLMDLSISWNNDKNDDPFLLACDNGQLDVAQYIVDKYDVVDQYDTMDNIKYSFCNVCEFGYLDMATWLYDNFVEWVDIHLVDDYAFRWACTNGHLDVAKWLHTLEDIDELNIEDGFCAACTKNQLDVAKWLFTLDEYINIHMSDDCILERVLMYGHIDMAKWLLTLDTINNFNLDWNCLFNYICAGGHLDVAKWVISVKPWINTSNRYCLCFSYACENGHIELAKWLLEIQPEVLNAEDVLTMTAVTDHMDVLEWLWTLDGIWKADYCITHAFVAACRKGHFDNMRWLYDKGGVDIHMMSEYPLRMACENSCTETFNWIISLDDDFDIRVYDDDAFYAACKNSNIHIAQWLADRCEDYKLTINTDLGQISEFKVVDSIEAALAEMEADYNKALEHLSITEHLEFDKSDKPEEHDEYDDMCTICRSHKDKLIMLPCKHIYCLNCLLLWHQSLKKTDNFRCAYCQLSYNWKECSSITIKNG